MDDFGKQVFLKASFDGAIIGSVRAYTEQDTCFIGRLIVHPNFQNQGIGTMLMDEIERCFSSARRFELFTGEKSERNIRLYRKLGYQAFERERITSDLTIVYMEKQV